MNSAVPELPTLPASWSLRLARSLSARHKLGLCERVFARQLARRGLCWVDFGRYRWKLNLANATHRWLAYGEYEEPGLRALLRQLLEPGSVVVDSGANIGQMILMYLLYGEAARIHAFEPTPAARGWLEECLVANGESRVTVAPVALGAQPGRSRLLTFAFDFKEGAKNCVAAEAVGERAIDIEIVPLDQFANHSGIQRIRFWKLDTEGHELPALQGATDLLTASAIDCLYIETGDQGGPIYDLLARHRYVATDVTLRRVLTRAEVVASFTNFFVGPSLAASYGHS
ncbi:MAG: FkbM family methyltransferase [Verrucomicrobia bacterium]|nr:FkbM family methyltransferase [Verrucomicrobiota bacterium]